MSKFSVISGIIAIILCIWVFFQLTDIQFEAWRDYNHVCDGKYGIGNWSMESAECSGFYIGQCWECVPNE